MHQEMLRNEELLHRFLNKDGLLKTLGISDGKLINQENAQVLKPTIYMNSYRGYHNVNDHRRDSCENKISVESNEISILSENGNDNLISSWTWGLSDLSKHKEIWNLFPDAIAAVTAPVGKLAHITAQVQAHLENLYKDSETSTDLEINKFTPAAHGKVVYYAKHNLRFAQRPSVPHIFAKRMEYSGEQEYRFVIECRPGIIIEVPVIYPLENANYIEKIYLNIDRMTNFDLQCFWRGLDFYRDRLEMIGYSDC